METADRRPVHGGDEEEAVETLKDDIRVANALVALAALSLSDIQAAHMLIAKAELGDAVEVRSHTAGSAPGAS